MVRSPASRTWSEGGKIFKRGYAYVQVDSRGFGGSEGCYDYGGRLEQLDATSAVEWAASQEWSNGRVGMWGKSYDAWTQVMALAHKPEGLEAAVVQSPIDDRYNIAFMNGVHWDAGWYATPALYGGYDLAPPSVNDSPPDEFLYPAKGTATDQSCYAKHPIYSGAMYDRSDPYWQDGEISGKARQANIPILWSHGFNDANTKPNNFMNTWDGYRGEKRGWFGQWDHVRGNEVEFVGRDGFLDEAMAFFDHHLKGAPAPKYPANVEVQDGEGRWRTEAAWPPRDADYDLGKIPVKPGSYPDDGSENGAWTFTQTAPYDVRFAGTPVLDVDVSTTLPNANLIATIWDVPPKGEATFVRTRRLPRRAGGACDLRALPAGLGPPQGPSFRASARLQRVAGSTRSRRISPSPSREASWSSRSSATRGSRTSKVSRRRRWRTRPICRSTRERSKRTRRQPSSPREPRRSSQPRPPTDDGANFSCSVRRGLTSAEKFVTNGAPCRSW